MKINGNGWKVWRVTRDWKPGDWQSRMSSTNRWSRELDQISRMAEDEGDGRFYYSGMAQAYLLDQLHLSWKLTLATDPMLNLEDLLRQALTVK